jgi:hypothetical protein
MYKAGQSVRAIAETAEMRKAIKALHPGTVDVRQLADRESGRDFLGTLLVAECGPQQPNPDALIVI